MENSDDGRATRVQTKQRRRIKLIVSAGAIALFVILVFEGVSLFSPLPARVDLVSFICSSYVGEQTFTVKANVNLTDGMSQDEATKVASIVLSEISQLPSEASLECSTNSKCDDEGIWTVEFAFGTRVHDASRSYGGSEAIPRILKVYVMTIDPRDQTVKYSLASSG